MFLPLKDSAPLRRIARPYVTYGVILANIVVFVLFQSGYLFRLEPNFSMGLGLIPHVIIGDAYLDGIPHVPTALTPLTALFLHGGWWHLASNMLFLWIFADNIEDSMGHARFIAFYLLCGALSGFAYAFSTPLSDMPLIGASGAIAAIVGAYLVLHPKNEVYGLIFNVIPLTLKAQWALGFWIVLQLGHGFFDPDRSVGWFAHIGGIVAGIVLIGFFKAKDVPFFGESGQDPAA